MGTFAHLERLGITALIVSTRPQRLQSRGFSECHHLSAGPVPFAERTCGPPDPSHSRSTFTNIRDGRHLLSDIPDRRAAPCARPLPGALTQDSGQNVLVKYSCRDSNRLSNSPLLPTPLLECTNPRVEAVDVVGDVDDL